MWKTIDLEPEYEVSDLGEVRNKTTKVVKKLRFDRGGYLRVTLYPSGKTYSIHRLVALAFLTRPDECNVVNHIDGVKTNNAVDNLEWCDNKHNVHHAYKMGLNTYRDIVGERNPSSKLTWKDVREIRERIRQGVPQTELAKRFNVQYACINRIHLNVTWKEST